VDKFASGVSKKKFDRRHGVGRWLIPAICGFSLVLF